MVQSWVFMPILHFTDELADIDAHPFLFLFISYIFLVDKGIDVNHHLSSDNIKKMFKFCCKYYLNLITFCCPFGLARFLKILWCFFKIAPNQCLLLKNSS